MSSDTRLFEGSPRGCSRRVRRVPAQSLVHFCIISERSGRDTPQPPRCFATGGAYATRPDPSMSLHGRRAMTRGGRRMFSTAGAGCPPGFNESVAPARVLRERPGQAQRPSVGGRGRVRNCFGVVWCETSRRCRAKVGHLPLATACRYRRAGGPSSFCPLRSTRLSSGGFRGE